MKKWLILGSLFVTLTSFAKDFKPISHIDLSLAKSTTLPLSERINFVVKTKSRKSLTELFLKFSNIEGKLKDDGVEVTMTNEVAFSRAALNKDLQASFVVDFDDSNSQLLLKEFQESVESLQSLEEIEKFAASYISNPTSIHGFNIASQVAQKRSGDCTEYAVIVAALARANGLPARIMLGTAIVEGEASVTAYGHAWTLIYKNDQWHRVDAALYGGKFKQVFYLPSGYLKNEGPGYNMSLFTAFANIPTEIQNVRSN